MEALTIMFLFSYPLNILVWTIRVLGGLLLLVGVFGLLTLLAAPLIDPIPTEHGEAMEPGEIPLRR